MDDSDRSVIIRGHVFKYCDKAPFVPSGMSVLGALEYDTAHDALKCHECGGYFSMLSGHVSVHGLTAIEYKKKHGLRFQSSLYSPGKKLEAAERMTAKPSMKVYAKGHPPLCKTHPSQKGSVQSESRNATGRCKAQMLFKIQTMAARLKRTPTAQEMISEGFTSHDLLRVFGKTRAEVLLMCGIKPNPTAIHMLDERMPWPKDYFTTPPRSATPLSGVSR